jgi:hypothetical protein
MKHEFDRRRFISTGGSLLLLLPLAQHCKSKSTKQTNTDSTKSKPTVKRVSKQHKPAITMAMVSNRGWYQHSKNKKIHYFDGRGYTPSLEFVKDKAQFDSFVKHLQPWDAKLISMETWQKNISKKKKDWITEHAALAFIAIENYSGAGTVIQDRIKQRPANLRLWDLMAITSLKDDQVKNSLQQLANNYSNTNDKRLYTHLAKFATADWQSKLRAKELTWNNQKI